MGQNNYAKFEIRGAIKEIMKNCNLRAFSIKNYIDYAWDKSNEFLILKNIDDLRNLNVHSVKYDIMNGYIKVYKNGNGNKVGDAFETVDNNVYQLIFDAIKNSLYMDIPSNIRRNILVKVTR